MNTLTWRERVALSYMHPNHAFVIGRKRIVLRLYLALADRGLVSVYKEHPAVTIFVPTDAGVNAYRADRLQRESDRVCGDSDVVL